MDYLSKINSEEFKKFKKEHGFLSINARINYWIEYLSDAKKFNSFFKDDAELDADIGRSKEIVSTYRVRDIDAGNWTAFKDNCSNKDMYANDAINVLVMRYNRKGDLFTVKIKV